MILRSVSLSFALGPRAQGSQMISAQSLRDGRAGTPRAQLWSSGLKFRDLGLSSALGSFGQIPS